MSAYRQFIESGGTDAGWEEYRRKMNEASRLKASSRLVERWDRGESIQGNDLANEFRVRGITLGAEVWKLLQHDDTKVSKTQVSCRGKRKEAKPLHEAVSMAIEAIR